MLRGWEGPEGGGSACGSLCRPTSDACVRHYGEQVKFCVERLLKPTDAAATDAAIERDQALLLGTDLDAASQAGDRKLGGTKET